MAPNPAHPKPLDVAREKQRIMDATQALRVRGLVEVVWLQGQTWRDLQKVMRQGPWHVFHFIGHGGFDAGSGEGVLVLADEDGQADYLSASQLGLLLADHRSLRLALLNSCESARGSEDDVISSTAAMLVKKGIPAVLAMQYEITDPAAVEFARAFYEALADGEPVDAAVAEARKAVRVALDPTLEWGIPVLHMRATDARIFDMIAEPPEPDPPISTPPSGHPRPTTLPEEIKTVVKPRPKPVDLPR